MKFKEGDKVRVTQEIEYVIPPRTKGIVKRAYPLTHSTFPYDVVFPGDTASFPLAESELEYSRWYRRLWDRMTESTKPKDAERDFDTPETEQAFLEIQELPPNSMVKAAVDVAAFLRETPPPK